MGQKQSLGGGYGINRNVSPDNVLTTAQPAMRGVQRVPGRGNPKEQGKSGDRHFSGATRPGEKND